MMDSFEGKVIAVAGVAGIGFSIAKLLHSRGARLSLADIDQKALDETFALLGSSEENVMITKVDISNAAQVGAWIDATVEKFGQLNGAANMAGVIGKHHGIRNLVDQDDDEWDLIMRVNLTGMMYCLRAELRRISPGGSIVNATSIQGVAGFAKHAAYSTSKHGVIGLTKSASKEAAPDVRVNAIAP
jgi:NAD(P)-dependent dehydrogenase (short-subunit alcohol dehydrogenase family)